MKCSGVALLVSLCALGACSDGPAQPVAVRVQAVVGGDPAAACAWPSTVRVDGTTGCTGTLIHARVVTTAAHCLDGTGSSAKITFGAGSNDPNAFSVTAECTAGVRGESGVNTSADWGYCVLPEDDRIAKIPITPPLVGCEAKRFLVPGAHAWVVGFGATSVYGNGFGTKRQVEVTVNELDKLAPGTIDVGDAQVGACHGDSGGPIYMRLGEGDADWGFRVFGSTSGPGGSFCDCTCSSTYVNIANHVAAIEKNEGIDVTPCTDADGNWDPGPDCGELPTDLANGSGSWPSCQIARTTDPIETCGPAAASDAGMTDAGAGGADAGQGGAGGRGSGGAGASGSGGIGAMGAGGNAASGGAGFSAGGAGGTTVTGQAGAAAPGASGTGGAASSADLGSGGASATPPPAFGTQMTPTAQPVEHDDDASCQVVAPGALRSGGGAWLSLVLLGAAFAHRSRRRRLTARQRAS